MSQWHSAYIALGSNLDNPLQQVTQAIHSLAAHPSLELIAQSSWYASSPLGPQDQPDFINGVIQIQTELAPFALLDLMQTTEYGQGRTRHTHWGPRTLDLDLLLYDQVTLETEVLTLPHAQMHKRNFVLIPLFEIEPNLILPCGTALNRLLIKLETAPNSITKL